MRLLPPFHRLLFLLGFIVLLSCSTSDLATKDSSSPNLNSSENLSPIDGGMWLLPQIQGPAYHKLQSQGLTLSQDKIYNPDGSSISQTIVQINTGNSQAGTGAFVSQNGLLLTNYGSVIHGLARHSTINQNYIHNGFYAESEQKEIPLENYSLRITLEQKDVTDRIKRNLSDSFTYRQKKKEIQQIKKKLVADRQAGNNNLAVEINEVWGENRYYMSVYKVIQDVRLVHVPAKPIGYDKTTAAFEGYAFLRAYVNPAGQSRAYHPSNVPFQPKKHLPVAKNNIDTGDVTITLGFPGQTQRYESSYAINFYKNSRNPMLIDTYQAMFDAAQYAAKRDSSTAIANAAMRLSLSHNLTYYRAIQQRIKADSIIKKKQTEEEQFSEWMKQDSLRNIRYRRVLSQLDQAYRIASQTGDLLYGLVNTINNNKLLQIAGLYHSYRQHISDSTNAAVDRVGKQKILQKHNDILKEINVEAHLRMLENMLYSLGSLPQGKVPFYLIELFEGTQDSTLKKSIHTYLQDQREKSIIFNLNRAARFLDLPADSARNTPKDALVTLYSELIDTYQFSRQNYSQYLPYMQPAQELYVEGLLEFRDDSVTYPDANGTLRLSLGKVKEAPVKSGHNSNIVNFVSTNDISGGSFGSPVLNNMGQIIGIVIKRAPKSMVNDIRYQTSLSHTVSLDIRHILSEISEFSEGAHLLQEMKILDD